MYNAISPPAPGYSTLKESEQFGVISKAGRSFAANRDEGNASWSFGAVDLFATKRR